MVGVITFFPSAVSKCASLKDGLAVCLTWVCGSFAYITWVVDSSRNCSGNGSRNSSGKASRNYSGNGSRNSGNASRNYSRDYSRNSPWDP